MTLFWTIGTWTLWLGPALAPLVLWSSSLSAPVARFQPTVHPHYGLERRRSPRIYNGNDLTHLWHLQSETFDFQA